MLVQFPLGAKLIFSPHRDASSISRSLFCSLLFGFLLEILILRISIYYTNIYCKYRMHNAGKCQTNRQTYLDFEFDLKMLRSFWNCFSIISSMLLLYSLFNWYRNCEKWKKKLFKNAEKLLEVEIESGGSVNWINLVNYIINVSLIFLIQLIQLLWIIKTCNELEKVRTLAAMSWTCHLKSIRNRKLFFFFVVFSLWNGMSHLSQRSEQQLAR